MQELGKALAEQALEEWNIRQELLKPKPSNKPPWISETSTQPEEIA